MLLAVLPFQFMLSSEVAVAPKPIHLLILAESPSQSLM